MSSTSRTQTWPRSPDRPFRAGSGRSRRGDRPRTGCLRRRSGSLKLRAFELNLRTRPVAPFTPVVVPVVPVKSGTAEDAAWIECGLGNEPRHHTSDERAPWPSTPGRDHRIVRRVARGAGRGRLACARARCRMRMASPVTTLVLESDAASEEPSWHHYASAERWRPRSATAVIGDTEGLQVCAQTDQRAAEGVGQVGRGLEPPDALVVGGIEHRAVGRESRYSDLNR